jgi:hypothetical protein
MDHRIVAATRMARTVMDVARSFAVALALWTVAASNGGSWPWA